MFTIPEREIVDIIEDAILSDEAFNRIVLWLANPRLTSDLVILSDTQNHQVGIGYKGSNARESESPLVCHRLFVVLRKDSNQKIWMVTTYPVF